MAHRVREPLFAAALGMVVTCIYLVGLLERKDRTVLRMRLDAFGILLVYPAGFVGVCFLR